MSNTSETYGIGTWIWNDRRNLGEILNERPGFYIDFLMDGGRNVINFNRGNDKFIGIFKDGIQINDNFFGGFDIENLSINEIDTIEEISNISSYLYGMNSQFKAINVITKNVFQPQLFSQLRFSQDRYGSENADVYFSQSFSRKFNWQIGATKNSIDGRYTNSDFDVWRGRGRINWFMSSKSNIRLNINYAKIQRGLNGGLIYSSEDTLRNPELAQVINPDSYEKLTNFYYDLSFTGRLFRDRNSLTKVKLYSQNSLREYRDEENRTNSNGIFLSRNFHSIQYGIDLKQNLSININKDLKSDILLGGNVYFNLFDYDIANLSVPLTEQYTTGKFNENYYTAITKLDFNYRNLFVSVSGKYGHLFNNDSYEGGIEASYIVYKNQDFAISFFGGINSTRYGLFNQLFANYRSFDTSKNSSILYSNYNRYYKEVGIKYDSQNLFIKLYQYIHTSSNSLKLYNGNYEIKFRSKYFDLNTNIDYKNVEYATNNPRFYVKSDFSFHNYFFNNNLNLRIGFNLKYIDKLKTPGYSDLTYTFNYYSGNDDSLLVNNLFNMDFYIGARIGSANINFTVANIFDNFNYNTFLYPWDDRGGALNSISRFTITWDFFN